MLNNSIIKYITEIDKIETILENIKTMGIDISGFTTSLSELTNEIESRVSKFGTIGYEQKENLNNIYQYGIEIASRILSDLEQYNNYYQAINKCYYIQGAQNLIEIKEEELSTVVDDVINLLNIINEFDGVADNSKEMLNRLYDFVYTLIKTEINYNGKSKMFDYCKNDEISVYFINKNLLREANDIRESGKDTNNIDIILSKSKDLDSTINEDLLQYISVIKNRSKYSEEYIKSLSALIRELKSNIDKIGGLRINKKYMVSNRKRDIEEYNYLKSYNTKKIFTNTLPFILSLSAVLGMHFGITRLVGGTEYKTDIQTYSSETGETIPTEEYIERIDEINGNAVNSAVFMEVKGPWEKAGPDKSGDIYFQRKVENYSIAGVNYDDLREYIDIDLSTIDGEYEYTEKIETKNMITASDSLTESEIEIVKQDQDPNDSRNGDLGGVGATVLVNILLSIVDLFILVCIEAMANNIGAEGPIERIFNLKDNISALRKKKHGEDDLISELNDIDEEIQKIINENSEIKKRYLELIQNPKYKFLNEIYNEKKEIINEYLEKINENAGEVLQLKV